MTILFSLITQRAEFPKKQFRLWCDSFGKLFAANVQYFRIYMSVVFNGPLFTFNASTSLFSSLYLTSSIERAFNISTCSYRCIVYINRVKEFVFLSRSLFFFFLGTSAFICLCVSIASHLFNKHCIVSAPNLQPDTCLNWCQMALALLQEKNGRHWLITEK